MHEITFSADDKPKLLSQVKLLFWYDEPTAFQFLQVFENLYSKYPHSEITIDQLFPTVNWLFCTFNKLNLRTYMVVFMMLSWGWTDCLYYIVCSLLSVVVSMLDWCSVLIVLGQLWCRREKKKEMVKIHPWEVESFKNKEMEMRVNMGGKKEGKARGSTRVGGVRKIYKRKSIKNSLISNSLSVKRREKEWKELKIKIIEGKEGEHFRPSWCLTAYECFCQFLYAIIFGKAFSTLSHKQVFNSEGNTINIEFCACI